jgi:hypothetical protein
MTTTRFRTSSASRAAACNMCCLARSLSTNEEGVPDRQHVIESGCVDEVLGQCVDLIFGNVLTEAQRSQLSR